MSVTIVTGGAGGLGQAIVADLAASGRDVVTFDRAATGSGASIALDVADEDAVDRAVARVRAEYGEIEGLVCAAGLVIEHPLTQMPLGDWHAVLDASLTGTFLTTRAVLPAMLEAHAGSIVAFSSGYASSGYRNGANYAAAKAGVEALIKSVALETAAHGIHANSIAPGPIDTPMVKPERAAYIGPLIPMGRIGRVDDVVGLVRFLLGPESSYITGQTIHVNGGLLLR